MKVIPAVLFVFSFSALALGQTSHTAKPKTMQGSGCVENAVETGCHILLDSKSGDTYNLFFSAKAPKAGTAIWFKGTVHQGMTTCMQGKPVNVTKWKKENGIKCLSPSSPAP